MAGDVALHARRAFACRVRALARILSWARGMLLPPSTPTYVSAAFAAFAFCSCSLDHFFYPKSGTRHPENNGTRWATLESSVKEAAGRRCRKSLERYLRFSICTSRLMIGNQVSHFLCDQRDRKHLQYP